MRRLRFVLILLAGVTASGLAIAGLALWWFRPTVEPPAWVDEYDVTAQQPEEIAPGTVIGNEPPVGWSHLIIKSLPRVRPADVPRLPSVPFVNLAQQVSWMFTAFVADVVPERQGHHTRYRLRAIGLGLGANVNGRDMILTSDSAQSLGVKLHPLNIEKQTLDTGYRIQRQSKVVLHGPSFALIDTPVTFRCKEKNRMVRYRYALLVDPPTGRLDVIAWRLGDGSGECADLARAVLLNPNTIDRVELIPDLAEFNKVGVPNERTFGVDDLPPHRLEIQFPPEVIALADKTKFTPAEAHAFETDLRKLLPQ